MNLNGYQDGWSNMRRYWRAINQIYEQVLLHAKLNPKIKSVHGAIVMYRHKVVAWGLNRPDRTVVDGECCRSMHAEVDALHRSHPRHQKRARELLVFRCARDGTFANSRCCPKCRAYLGSTGIRRVVYTDDTGQLVIESMK